MPPMPSGLQTGIFYIPVGNLPWNTTWKKLKDFARNVKSDGSALAIVHAYVYPGETSTSGWVSVQGLEDFRAAVYHLNHSAMEDPPRASRTLQADDRNEKYSVMLAEAIPATTSSSYPRVQVQSSWQPQILYTQVQSSQVVHNAWSLQSTPVTCSTPMSPSFSDSSYYQIPSPHPDLSQNFAGFGLPRQYLRSTQSGILTQMPLPMSPMSPISPMQQQVYVFPVEQQMDPVLQMFTPQPPQMLARPQQQCVILSPPPLPRSSPKVAQTEARKIIVTGLHSAATQKEVQDLIQSVSSTATQNISSGQSSNSRNCRGPDGTRFHLQHLELAKHSNGTPKGHAFAILESHCIAKSTIDALNGMTWQGRRLRARFAKEGAESRNRSNRDKVSLNYHEPGLIWSQFAFNAMSSGVVSPSTRSRESHTPRTLYQEPHHRYTGADNVTEANEFPVDQFANIQIDYRDDNSSSSSSPVSPAKEETNASSASSLSLEGETEREQKVLSDDVRSPTPVVVDGSCRMKRC